MARVKKDSVVADEKIVDTSIVDDYTGEVTNYVAKYEIIPQGRTFILRHWNGGALPRELEGMFTSLHIARVALANYYKRKNIPDEERNLNYSGTGNK